MNDRGVPSPMTAMLSSAVSLILALGSSISLGAAPAQVRDSPTRRPSPTGGPTACLSSSESDFSAKLDKKRGLWLVQSKNSGIYTLALARSDERDAECRRPLATLTAPAGRYFEYRCVDPVHPRVVTVGTMSESRGHPEAAWQIDYDRSTFIPVTPDRVNCENIGYEKESEDPRWDLRSEAAKRKVGKR